MKTGSKDRFPDTFPVFKSASLLLDENIFPLSLHQKPPGKTVANLLEDRCWDFVCPLKERQIC